MMLWKVKPLKIRPGSAVPNFYLKNLANSVYFNSVFIDISDLYNKMNPMEQQIKYYGCVMLNIFRTGSGENWNFIFSLHIELSFFCNPILISDQTSHTVKKTSLMFIRNGYFERNVYIGSYYYYYSIFMMGYRYILFIIKTKKIGTKESFRSHLLVKQQFPKSI